MPFAESFWENGFALWVQDSAISAFVATQRRELGGWCNGNDDDGIFHTRVFKGKNFCGPALTKLDAEPPTPGNASF